jgi:hypothetical protein
MGTFGEGWFEHGAWGLGAWGLGHGAWSREAGSRKQENGKVISRSWQSQIQNQPVAISQ